jgi:pimeloyl-ACP methyl ester carboxylesterase
MTTRDHAATAPLARGASGVYVETWGDGTPVVLVHGSLACGAEEWEAQRPLADAGFRLRVLDRRGYGRSAGAAGEDFLGDADDIADIMGDGAHVVGHSYGGLGAMLAAARRPEATLSLTLLEPAAAAVAAHDEEWRQLVAELRHLWAEDLPDHDWVVRFLKAVGSDPDEFPAEMLAAALPLVPVLRRGRPFYEAELPLAELAAARFPKLVVSGGHHRGLDAMCIDLAEQIGGTNAVVAGAGHEIQFVGEALNTLLAQLWRQGSSAHPPSRPSLRASSRRAPAEGSP